MQTVTGTLSPGAHAGSYNGQDAYNDMLVVYENNNNKSQFHAHGRDNGRDSEYVMCDRQQGPSDSDDYRGGGTELEEPVMMSDRKGHNGITEDGISTTLTAQEKERPIIGTSIVRRLTPLECERLQGFPDGWTDIGDWTDSKGKKHKAADTPRYKALGNSIAMPFWKFLARRICAQYERDITMGSLFDGIGGFPLAFESAGAKAIWASEIEEFPIAVTKIHFPEKIEGDSESHI